MLRYTLTPFLAESNLGSTFMPVAKYKATASLKARNRGQQLRLSKPDFLFLYPLVIVLIKKKGITSILMSFGGTGSWILQ